MSNSVDYAEKELRRAGWFDQNSFYGDMMGEDWQDRAPADDAVEAIIEMTEADYANVIAHLSPELAPAGPLPNRNSLMMEVVRLRNQVKAFQPDAVEALVKAAEAFSDAYRTWSLVPRRRAGEKDAFADMHRRKVDLDAALAAYRGGAK